MAVRVVAVQDEVAGDLDLVGRVVVVEPGRGRLAQPDLEQHRRHEQQRRRPPCRARRPSQRGQDAQPPRRRRRRAATSSPASIPGVRTSPRSQRSCPRPHDRAEQAVRVHGRRPERPRVGAELRHGDRDERAEHAEQDPGPARGSSRRLTRPRRVAPRRGSRRERRARARRTGRRRSRCRRASARSSARKTAASPRPNAGASCQHAPDRVRRPRRAARRRGRSRRSRAPRRRSAASCARRRTRAGPSPSTAPAMRAAATRCRRPRAGGGRRPRPVSTTRRERSLVARCVDACATRFDDERAAGDERDARPRPPRSSARCGRRRRARRTTVTANRAAKLDCEYEKKSPANSTATSAAISQRAHVAVPERDQQHRDPEHDVAPVQARVAEERGDAEEVRVRVPDLDRRRVEEQPVRRLLDDPDDREQRRERDDDRARGRAASGAGTARARRPRRARANGSRKYSSRLRAGPDASDQSSESEAKARNAASRPGDLARQRRARPVRAGAARRARAVAAPSTR